MFTDLIRRRRETRTVPAPSETTTADQLRKRFRKAEATAACLFTGGKTFLAAAGFVENEHSGKDRHSMSLAGGGFRSNFQIQRNRELSGTRLYSGLVNGYG